MSKAATKPKQPPRTRATTHASMRESATGYGAVDPEAGIISGVRVLGLVSLNGREYLKEAVSQSLSLYEGSKVFLDHAESSERAVSARWGMLKSVRQDADGGLSADLHYLKTHPRTPEILEAIERFCDFGLSHDVEGEMTREGDKSLVTKITRVNSVDVVCNPATTKSLFESEKPRMTKHNLRKLLRENKSVPVAGKLLAKILEMGDSLYPEDMGVEMTDEAPAAEDAVDAAFKAAIVAIVDMADLSTDEKIAKIKMLLDVSTELAGGAAADPAAPPAADAAAMESLRLELTKTLKEAEALRAENKILSDEKTRAALKEACTKLLSDASREVTEGRVKILAALPESARAELVDSWPKLEEGKQKPPVSHGRSTESEKTEPKYDDAQSLKALLGVGK